MRALATLSLSATLVAPALSAAMVFGIPAPADQDNRSPISWVLADPGVAQIESTFVPPPAILGSTVAPASVTLVEFKDECSFGEARQHTSWLARFDSVAVVGDVPLNLVFDVATHQMVCAFTDPSSNWVRASELEDLEAVSTWKMHPARYSELRSNVTQVVLAFRRQFGLGVGHAGQLIVRPRYNDNQIESPRPMDSPSNVWIVEFLGERIMERHGKVLTTFVYVYRDGDLKGMFGKVRP